MPRAARRRAGKPFCAGVSASMVEILNFTLDPCLDARIDLFRLEAFGLDRCADAHRDQAGMFAECIASPQPSGVMRHLNHRHTGTFSQQRAADLVLAALAERDARPSREDPPAKTLRESFLALPQQLPHRARFLRG